MQKAANVAVGGLAGRAWDWEFAAIQPQQVAPQAIATPRRYKQYSLMDLY